MKMKGFLISFSGIDGAGKTTLARNTVKALKNKGIRCRYVYGRLQPLILKPFFIIARKSFLKGEDLFRNYQDYSHTKRKTIRRHSFLFAIYRYILLLDYSLQLLFRIRIPLLLGRNIICDRYISDTVITDLAVDTSYSITAIKRLINRLYRIAPRPALAFLIDLPEEIAFQRKNDTPAIDYLKERRNLYLNIGREYKIVILDGRDKLDQLGESVLQKINTHRIQTELFKFGNFDFSDLDSATIKLLRIIGSPFLSSEKPLRIKSKKEAQELYPHAVRNKIGLLYLETLAKQRKLEEFGLSPKYQKERKRHAEQQLTAVRIARLFNTNNIDYVLYKSIIPYPAVPNDVDILHLGSKANYRKAVELILNSDYEKIADVSSPAETEVHDTRDGPHTGSQTKDVYDIDLYKKVAASYIVYMKRERLKKYATESNVLDEPVKVLDTAAELAVTIAHAVIIEQLCTLFVYYTTLHHLAGMEAREVDTFLKIVREHNITFSVKVHCYLVAALHQTAHGFVPPVVEEILLRLGYEAKEIKSLLDSGFHMPHRYSLLTVFRALWDRMKDGEFRAGAIRQVVHMLNPKFGKPVIEDLIWRRRRETY